MLLKKINLLIIGILLVVSGNAQIWPGDANNNGKADQVDMLFIGWAFGNTGSEREIQGTAWADAGSAIEAWQDIFPNGNDYSFADCDGNGIINESDFGAVIENFYNEHGDVSPDGYLNGVPGEAPAIALELSSNIINTGEELTIDLFLGDDDFSVDDFHGIALSISYSSQHETPLSSVAYEHDANSWVNANSDIFSRARHITDAREIGLAITRTTGKTIDGDGLLGSLSIIIEDIVLSYDIDTIHLQIDSVKMIGSNFTTFPVVPTSVDFIVRRASQDNCPLAVQMIENSCSSFTFIAESLDNDFVFWSINDEYFDEPGSTFTFEADEAGTYTICAGYETPECPEAVFECFTVTISEDCLESDPCAFEIGVDPASCSDFYFYTTQQEQVDWFVNDNYIGFSMGFEFNAEAAGSYIICALIETGDCPLGASQCQTIVIEADCFDDNCPLAVQMIENNCSSFTFIAESLDNDFVFWSINDEYFDEPGSTFTFEADEAGDYIICAGYETPECPEAVFECFTVTVSEDCLESDPCAFEIEVDLVSCSDFYFYTTQQEQVDWFVDDNYIGFSMDFEFNADEAGTYVICALIETPECPQGASQCQTIVIESDCFDDNCSLDFQMIENSCSSFTFTAESFFSAFLFWSVSDEYMNESNSSFTFEVDEAGTYEICAGYETLECPQVVLECFTVIVSQDCIDGPTSVEELNKQITLSLSPNPSHDYVTINLEEYSELSYQVLDMSGKVVMNATPQTTLNHRLDISHLANGVYVIHAIVNGKSTRLRFVKQ